MCDIKMEAKGGKVVFVRCYGKPSTLDKYLYDLGYRVGDTMSVVRMLQLSRQCIKEM